MKQLYLLTFNILLSLFAIGQDAPESTIIPTSSKQLTPFIFEDAQSFSCGYAAVKKDGKWGFIDLDGKLVVPCVYDKVRSFRNGVGAVSQSGKWWLLNNKGVKASEAFEKINHYDNAVKARKDGKWGAYDFDLNQIVPHKYSYFQLYDSRFLRIERGKGSISNRFVGVLSIEGDTIIPLEYKIIEYNDGVFVVQDDEQREAYFDEEGKQQSRFDDRIMEVMPFNNGYGGVCLMDGCLIMDDKFILFPQNFIGLGENHGSYFPASKDGVSWGLYDIALNSWAVRPIYNELSILNEKYVSCSKSGKYGILDFDGTEVMPFVSTDEITLLDNVAYLSSEDGLKGAFCFKTGYMFPMKYQNVVGNENGSLFLCKKDGRWSVLNGKGQLIKSAVRVTSYPTFGQNRLKVKDESGNVGFIVFQ